MRATAPDRNPPEAAPPASFARRAPPPLALYVHVPWCVRKCPYCDFNSHAVTDELPERDYIAALLADLDQDAASVPGRPLQSVFIGGGTPSLLSGEAIAHLLDGIRCRMESTREMEVTLEANPGTVEAERFERYRRAGVNRLSLGIQSFSAESLVRLGRIHDPKQAQDAVGSARAAGFANLNLDLMFGLPGQTLAAATADLTAALDLMPEHISYYQLTLEPNTPFARRPPALPDEDLVADMHLQGQETLSRTGYCHYEVSAYSLHGRECRHNLNYWRFGDYLGIGAGAHGKLSDPTTGQVERRWKSRHPQAYLNALPRRDFISGRRRLTPLDLQFEFMLNALRLAQGFAPRLFEERTGLRFQVVQSALTGAVQRGLLETSDDRIRPTELGQRFLNDLLQLFLTDGEDDPAGGLASIRPASPCP